MYTNVCQKYLSREKKFTAGSVFRIGQCKFCYLRPCKQAGLPNQFACSSNLKVHALVLLADLCLCRIRSPQCLSIIRACFLSGLSGVCRKIRSNRSKPDLTRFLSLRDFLEFVDLTASVFNLIYAFPQDFHVFF